MGTFLFGKSVCSAAKSEAGKIYPAQKSKIVQLLRAG